MALPSTPKGFYLRLLQEEDADILVPHWQQLDQALDGTPCWRSWKSSLIDIRNGTFHHDLLHVAGLFDQGGILVACVAETVSLDNGQISEINFNVLPQCRKRGLGTLCLRAGMALAKSRGSRMVRVECAAECTAALAMLRMFGTTPVRMTNRVAYWRTTLGLSTAAAGTLAMKRQFRRLFAQSQLE